jgi:hypothetical protein
MARLSGSLNEILAFPSPLQSLAQRLVRAALLAERLDLLRKVLYARAALARLSVGAVNVRTGNFLYFDTERQRIGPEHIMVVVALHRYSVQILVPAQLLKA